MKKKQNLPVVFVPACAALMALAQLPGSDHSTAFNVATVALMIVLAATLGATIAKSRKAAK